jgi:hypothetical protein
MRGGHADNQERPPHYYQVGNQHQTPCSDAYWTDKPPGKCGGPRERHSRAERPQWVCIYDKTSRLIPTYLGRSNEPFHSGFWIMNCATWRGNQDQDQLDMTAHGSQRTRHTAHIMYAKVRSRGSILPPKSHETELTGRSQPTYNLPTSRDPPPRTDIKNKPRHLGLFVQQTDNSSS